MRTERTTMYTSYNYGLNIKLELIGQPKQTVMELYSYCLF